MLDIIPYIYYGTDTFLAPNFKLRMDTRGMLGLWDIYVQYILVLRT